MTWTWHFNFTHLFRLSENLENLLFIMLQAVYIRSVKQKGHEFLLYRLYNNTAVNRKIFQHRPGPIVKTCRQSFLKCPLPFFAQSTGQVWNRNIGTFTQNEPRLANMYLEDSLLRPYLKRHIPASVSYFFFVLFFYCPGLSLKELYHEYKNTRSFFIYLLMWGSKLFSSKWFITGDNYPIRHSLFIFSAVGRYCLGERPPGDKFLFLVSVTNGQKSKFLWQLNCSYCLLDLCVKRFKFTNDCHNFLKNYILK